MLSREIAADVVRETMIRLNRNINMMNEDGVIIASGDPNRINQIHEGALQVIKTGKSLIITCHNQENYPGSLLGINLPVEFQGKVVGVIGITGDPAEVEEFGGLVKMTTEMMIRQSYQAGQTEWEQRVAEMIIEELIHPQPSWEFIEQRLDLLSIHFGRPLSVFILDMEERTINRQQLISIVKTIFNPQHCLTGFLSVNRLFILSIGLDQLSLKNKAEKLISKVTHLDMNARIGVGTMVTEPTEIGLSYQEAELALSLEQGIITFYADFEAKALIYQLDNEIKNRYLSRLIPKLSAKTIETLQTFFHCNQNITQTAQELFVHRNTLVYRLSRIKEQTGFDPHLFSDAVALQMAVWMYESLHKETD